MRNTPYVFIMCVSCIVCSCRAGREKSIVVSNAAESRSPAAEEFDAAEKRPDWKEETDLQTEAGTEERKPAGIQAAEPMRVFFSEKEKNKHRARAVNMMAVMYDARDESKKAVQGLKQCIIIYPSNPYYYEKLGLILSGSGRSSEQKQGYELLEQAASRGSENSDIYFMLGEYFRKNGDPGKMAAYFEQFISMSPSLREQAEKAGLLYRKRGFSLKSYEEQKKLLKLKISYQQLANVYKKRNDLKRHIRVLLELSAISDTYKIGLAYTYMDMHQFQKALKTVNSIENVYDLDEQRFSNLVYLKNSLCTVPGFLPEDVQKGIYSSVTNNIRVYLSIKGNLNRVLLAGISFCSRSGNENDTEEFIEKLISGPADPDTVAGAVLVLAGHRQHREGLSLIENVEKQLGKGTNKGLSVLKGGLLSALGRIEEARQYIEDVISSAGGEIAAELYGKTARFLSDMRYFKEAEYFYLKCLKKDPDSVVFISGYAYVLYRTGRPDRAFSRLDSLLRKLPEGNSQVENMYGYLLSLENRDLSRALSLIGKALDREPENAAYLDSMGWVYFKKGDLKKAEQYLIKAALKAENEEIYDHCGDFYYAAGEPEKARKFWIDSYLIRQSEAVREKIQKVNRQFTPDKR